MVLNVKETIRKPLGILFVMLKHKTGMYTRFEATYKIAMLAENTANHSNTLLYSKNHETQRR